MPSLLSKVPDPIPDRRKFTGDPMTPALRMISPGTWNVSCRPLLRGSAAEARRAEEGDELCGSLVSAQS